MKQFNFFSLLIIFILLPLKYTHANNSVAILDLDSLLEKTNAGKKIINELNLINQNNLNSLKEMENKIKSEQENINNQKNIISNEELNKKINNLNKEIKKFQNKKNELVNNFNTEKEKKLDLFFKEIIPIIENYIDKNEINLVFDKKNIFIANKKNNITEEIIKIIDERLE